MTDNPDPRVTRLKSSIQEAHGDERKEREAFDKYRSARPKRNLRYYKRKQIRSK